ncbi:MFS general substrate transporter [Dacryopinax primogenitus]|uniref:MFS general substrate transporter n=1 Tax=Dacryopinax primogenitus (strain DJM 731) TaxID=1858805 RepID=M5FU92_DACPD|nr:MFS general substrate transporter [Dacryopinax primogenitus]EJT99758.1 MFS general substrate transporter [Dacryopinax primogenitus]
MAAASSGATTPLLADMEDDELEQDLPKPVPLSGSPDSISSISTTPLKSRRPTPLPKFQLLVLCIIMLAEPVSYTQLFPYVNDMCYKLGWAASEKEVGHISGLIDGLFAIANLLTVMHWGRLSDRIGRRPVLILGLVGLASCNLVFGLSQNLWVCVAARLAMGALCGNGVVTQSIVSELTDETNEAQAFAFMSLMWAVGCIVGPTIGGTFSRPAEQLPHWFDTPFWQANPYLLPCLISAGIMILSLASAALLLKETLPAAIRAKRANQTEQERAEERQEANEHLHTSERTYGAMDEQFPQEAVGILPRKEDRVWTTWELVNAPGMVKAMACTFLMMFVNQAWDIVFILYSYTNISLGGLSLSNIQIGYCLSFAGSVGACIQIFIFPRIQRRFGMRMYPVVLAVLLFMFPAAPVLSNVVRGIMGEQDRGDAGALAVVGGCGLAFMGRVAAMVFPLTYILCKRITPAPSALASTAALGATVAAGARAIAPWFVSSLFAWSVDLHLLGGYLIWVLMTLIVLWCVWYARDLDTALADAERVKAERLGNVDAICGP